MLVTFTAPPPQAKLRETFSQKVVDKCKELERELAKCRNLADDRNVEGGADFDEVSSIPNSPSSSFVAQGLSPALGLEICVLGGVCPVVLPLSPRPPLESYPGSCGAV